MSDAVRVFAPMGRRVIVFASAVVLMGIGCGRKDSPPRPTMTSFEAEGEKAAQAWLAIVDAGDYGKALEQCVFKEAPALDPAQPNILQAVRAPVGRLKDRALVGISSGEMPLGGGQTQKMVQMVYRTDFSDKSECTESITLFIDTPTTWKVGAYHLTRGL